MNFKSTAVMLLLIGATEAVRISEMSGPSTTTSGAVVESSTEGIPNASQIICWNWSPSDSLIP